jgi:hypothetical protein
MRPPYSSKEKYAASKASAIHDWKCPSAGCNVVYRSRFTSGSCWLVEPSASAPSLFPFGQGWTSSQGTLEDLARNQVPFTEVLDVEDEFGKFLSAHRRGLIREAVCLDIS